MNQVELVSNFLGILTIIGDIGIIVLISLLLLERVHLKLSFITKLRTLFGNAGLRLAWVITLIATLGSLFYSDIAGFTPCTLCWYQRIFMYPQVILLGIALLKKDRSIIKYSLVLSGIGALIATYHYFLQTTKIEIIPCSAVGYSVSCTKTFVLRFGYITIPMMSLTAFVLVFLLMYYYKKFKKPN